MPDEIKASADWKSGIAVDGTKILDDDLVRILLSNLDKNVTVRFSPELKDLPMQKFNESLFEALKQRCSQLPKILEETPAGKVYYAYGEGRRCARFYFDSNSYRIDFSFRFNARDIILLVEGIYLSGVDSAGSVKGVENGAVC